MTDVTAGRADAPVLDEEASGIDRPGLHASAGERPQNEHFGDVLARNIARRSFLLGAAASVPVLMTAKVPGLSDEAQADEFESDAALAKDGRSDRLAFRPIEPSQADEVIVPNDYEADVLLRWGDPLFEGAPEFSIHRQTAESQSQQFGYNCDFVGFFPLEGATRALLCVNHEYTSASDMFRDYVAGVKKSEVDVEMAAHGGSVVEIRKSSGRWSVVIKTTTKRSIRQSLT